MTDSQPSRRRVLRATVALASLTAVAGCSGITGDGGGGGGADGSGDGDGGDGTTTGGETTTATTTTDGGPAIGSMCEVETDTVDGLSVVGCRSEISDGNFVATITIRNEGDQEINLFDYDLEMEFYSSTEPGPGDEVYGTVRTEYTGEPPPGGTQVVTATLNPNSASPDDVRLYTVSLECDSFYDAPYCE